MYKGGRIDYSKYNYCSRCEKTFLKPIRFCPECGWRMRTKCKNANHTARYRERVKRLLLEQQQKQEILIQVTQNIRKI